MHNTIVIDFGTSRTKAAYYDPKFGPSLITLGTDKFLPSIFYVEEDGEILYGDRAHHILESQKIGEKTRTAPIRGLKLKLRASLQRWRKKYTSEDLLTPLFTHIRERAANTDGFDKTYPTKVILTTTKRFSPADRKMLECAAQKAGFEQVELITEPEAVAQGWVTKTSPGRPDVIVLDCGGGTTDWTYLHREDSNFRIVPHLRGDAEKVGGHNVDEALAKIIASKSAKSAKDPRLLNKVSRIKEMFCNGIAETDWPPIEIESQSYQLNDKQIEQAIHQAFIDPVCEAIGPFIEKVKEDMGKGSPAILLVGGSAKLHGLKDALENEFGCEVNSDWTEAEFAPVLGAVPIPSESGAAQTNENEVKELDLQLANQFDDIALLIGKPQKKESEFTVGEKKQTVAPGLQISTKHVEKLRQRAEALRNGSLRLAVVGDASAGKSTLINAMIGEQLLPEADSVCSCIPVEIVSGSNTETVTIFQDGGKKITIGLDEFKEEYRFTPEEQPKPNSDPIRPERFKGIKCARLESESELCTAGIRLVDTLGANADSLSDDITRRFVEEADALLVVMRNPNITDSTNRIIKAFVNAKGGQRDGIFFVHNVFVTTRDKRDEKMKNAALNLHSPLIDEFDGDESRYDKRVFIVDAAHAFDARTAFLNDQEQLEGAEEQLKGSERQLEESRLPKLEEELKNFLRSRDRVSVVMRTAFILDLVPAYSDAQSHIGEVLASFKKSVDEKKKDVSRAKTGLSDLRRLVKDCETTTEAWLVNRLEEVTRLYRHTIEYFFADADFEEYWKSRNSDMKKALNEGREQVEEMVDLYIGDQFKKVIEQVNSEVDLAQEIQEVLKPIVQEFFTTLNRIKSDKKVEKKGILSDTQFLAIQSMDVYRPTLNTLSISLTTALWEGRGFWWKASNVITLGIPAMVQGIINKSRRKNTRKLVLDALKEVCDHLQDGPVIKRIKKTSLQECRDIVKTVEARLSAEIEVTERQLADASGKVRDETRTKKRLQKIDHILTAKYEGICRDVSVKPEEVQTIADQVLGLQKNS